MDAQRARSGRHAQLSGIMTFTVSSGLGSWETSVDSEVREVQVYDFSSVQHFVEWTEDSCSREYVMHSANIADDPSQLQEAQGTGNVSRRQ